MLIVVIQSLVGSYHNYLEYIYYCGMDVQHGCRLNDSMRLLGGTRAAASTRLGWVVKRRRHADRSGVVQTYASVKFRPCIDIHKVR